MILGQLKWMITCYLKRRVSYFLGIIYKVVSMEKGLAKKRGIKEIFPCPLDGVHYKLIIKSKRVLNEGNLEKRTS